MVCGILSPLVYVAANIVGAMRWDGCGSLSQTNNKLSAINAPSRAVWIPFGLAYDLLVIVFGVGVWSCARRRGLRVAADGPHWRG
jgi:hypothetical protein